jgi:hypothetical protein
MPVEKAQLVDLAASIRRSRRPVTFLIGAGASISSGAPATAEVEAAFAPLQQGRYAGQDLRAVLHTLPKAEKQDILAPLFAGVRPNVGYRALAALAMHKPVIVLNLNWDGALSDAAAMVGTKEHCRDIQDIDPLAPPVLGATGLLNLHLHGILGGDCRFGTLETLTFPEPLSSYLVDQCLRQMVVIVGASLRAETDLPGVFASAQQSGAAGTVWYFGRPEAAARTARAHRMTITGSPFTHFDDIPGFDFDDFMVDLYDTFLAHP